VKGGTSIRGRLVLALAGVSLFTLLVVGAVFYLFLGKYVIDRQRDLLLDQAIEVAEQVQGVSESLPMMTGAMRGKGMLNALLRSDLRVLPAGSGILVFSGSAVIASVGIVPNDAGVRDSLRIQAERLGGSMPASALVVTVLGRTGRKGPALLAAAPIQLADDATGLAVVTLARSDAFSYRTGILRSLLISGGIAVLLAVLVGWMLGAWMTRPLRRLSAAARGIAGSSYQQPVTGSYPGEIQELADDLESMRREVQHSENSLRGFVSSAAHELRTPLTSIQGFSQALLDGTAETEAERLRSAAAIHRESTRLRRLVDTLLTLSRYDSHEFQPNLTEVALEGLVREEADRLLQAGMVEPGRIVVQVEGEARTVTDGDMLRRVIANLLHNAVQYGEQGPVEVGIKTQDGRVLLEVANGGQPLSSEDRPRLFSRFYRGRGGRQTEGFGLGLALVWEICDLLGGKVELVDGDPLTRFRVTLPLIGGQAAKGQGGR
jgi:signal transduction histidine kinase